jgi:hypothetical protein
MFHVITGGTPEQQKKAINAILDTITSPLIMRAEADTLSVFATKTHLESETDIFGNTPTLIVYGGLTHKDTSAFFARELPLWHKLPSHTLCIETSITAPIKKILEKQGIIVQALAIPPKKESTRDTTVFAVTDALLTKDKKNLWINYQKALVTTPLHEIMAVIHWQIRILALVTRGVPAETASIAPFPYKKTVRYAHTYSHSSVLTLLAESTCLIYELRTASDPEALVELWLLKSVGTK